MTTTPAAPPAPKTPWLQNRHPAYRLALRWLFIAAATALAFHDTLASVADTVRSGGLNSYVVLLPPACLMAAIGVARRNRSELPIHDRQTDIIVGLMGLGLAMLLKGVLLGRYTQYFHLLRLDLVAMWMFLISACVVLFGLRPVYRFRWVWILLLAVFPLPYHIGAIRLGGTRVAAGLVSLLIAALATAVMNGHGSRRSWIGFGGAWAVGIAVLAGMRVFTPDASLVMYQVIPALTAIVSVSAVLFVQAQRGGPLRLLDRKVEPLAAAQVWAGVPLVLVVACALAFMPLPDHILPTKSELEQVSFGSPLPAPAGWHLTDTREYPWVSRVYGPGAKLIRQKFVADRSNPQWDKLSRPRAIVVDSVTSARPFAFQTYPAKVLYHVSGIRQSTPREVDLGHSVTGSLASVVDDNILITWNALDWVWGNSRSAQQVTVFAVDNHEPDAPFPQPTGALAPTLNTLFTVLFRGNSAAADLTPSFKDADMVTEFSTKLVAAQLTPSDQR